MPRRARRRLSPARENAILGAMLGRSSSTSLSLRQWKVADVPLPRLAALIAFCAAAVFLIPVEWYVPGGFLWAISAFLVWRDPEAAFKRRMAVLLGAIAILAAAPIHTDTSTRHFIALGIPFLAVVLGPALILGRTDPGVIRYRFKPRRFRWLDVGYVAISIPLAWLVFELYFKVVNTWMPTHWALPSHAEVEASWRLFIGINCVGMWDELFFVNTVFAVLRSIFPFRVANAAQAVVYASVLTDMAFTGIGPVIVFLFALTQGAMFEESDNLLYVLLVHVIVDVFLLSSIFNYYYPGFTPIPF